MLFSGRVVNFGFQQSILLLMVVFCTVSASRFQSFANFPTMIDMPQLPFGNFFSTPTTGIDCEDERKNCISKCTEERMIFHCSSLLSMASTCTCTSPSILQVTPLQQESVRCNFAREQCELTCGPNPNFQCSDQGLTISQSCACTHVSNLVPEEEKQGIVLASEVVVGEGTTGNYSTEIESLLNAAFFGQSSNSSDLIVPQLMGNSNMNISDLSLVQVEVLADGLSDYVLNFQPSQSLEGSVLKFIGEITEADKKSSLPNVFPFADDKIFKLKYNDTSGVFFIVDSQEVSANAQNTVIDTIPVPVPVPTSSVSTSTDNVVQSAVGTVAVTENINANTIKQNNNKNDDEDEDEEEDGDQKGVTTQGQKQVQSDQCAKAKKDCQNQCKNLDIDFDCQVNGLNIAQSCACVSKATPSSQQPAPVPAPAYKPVSTSVSTPTTMSEPVAAPSLTPVPLIAPEEEKLNKTQKAQVPLVQSNQQSNQNPDCQKARTDCEKKCKNLKIDFDCQVDGLTIAQSCACVSKAASPSQSALPAKPAPVPSVAAVPQPPKMLAPVVEDDNKQIILDTQGQNQKIDPKCIEAKKDCEKKCLNLEINFDCQVDGLNIAQSCACVSLPASNSPAVSSLSKPNPPSSPTPVGSPTLNSQESLSVASPTKIVSADSDSKMQGEVMDVELDPKCIEAKKDCEKKCINLGIDFDCQVDGLNIAQSCACVSLPTPIPSAVPASSLKPNPPSSPTPVGSPTVNSQGSVPAASPTKIVAVEADSQIQEKVVDVKQVQSASNTFKDVECQLAAENCQLMCGDMKPEFDCQKVGIMVSQSCACSSANVAPASNGISEAVVISDASNQDEPIVPLTESVNGDVTTTGLSNNNQMVQQVIPSKNVAVEPECQQAKEDCQQQCMDSQVDFDCQKVGGNIATSCACAQNTPVGNMLSFDDFFMPGSFGQRVMNTLDKQNQP